LKDREKRIIEAYYGLDGNLPMTLAEIGAEEGINVTREMVRQIKEKSLKKLKDKLENSELKEHFNF
jgi:RNA polymerase primary sigma factor